MPVPPQSARKLTVDGLTLYAESAGTVSSVSPSADLVGLSAGLSGSAGQALIDLPADSIVMTRVLSQQVFLVLQYHFGNS